MPGRPAWWSLIRPSPATFRLMPGGWALPPWDRSPTRRGEAPGTELAFLSVAVQRANARPEDPFIGAWVRALVRLGAVATSSTAKGHLNPGLTNDDRNGDCEGLTGSREPRRTRQFAEKHV